MLLPNGLRLRNRRRLLLPVAGVLVASSPHAADFVGSAHAVLVVRFAPASAAGRSGGWRAGTAGWNSTVGAAGSGNRA